MTFKLLILRRQILLRSSWRVKVEIERSRIQQQQYDQKNAQLKLAGGRACTSTHDGAKAFAHRPPSIDICSMSRPLFSDGGVADTTVVEPNYWLAPTS